MTHPAPPAQNSLTPHLVVDNAREAIDFYKRALRAQEMYVLTTPDGRGIMHAQLQIGESHLFLCDAMGENCSSRESWAAAPSPFTCRWMTPTRGIKPPSRQVVKS